jgi:hypothetical protein
VLGKSVKMLLLVYPFLFRENNADLAKFAVYGHFFRGEPSRVSGRVEMPRRCVTQPGVGHAALARHNPRPYGRRLAAQLN